VANFLPRPLTAARPLFTSLHLPSGRAVSFLCPADASRALAMATDGWPSVPHLRPTSTPYIWIKVSFSARSRSASAVFLLKRLPLPQLQTVFDPTGKFFLPIPPARRACQSRAAISGPPPFSPDYFPCFFAFGWTPSPILSENPFFLTNMGGLNLQGVHPSLPFARG